MFVNELFINKEDFMKALNFIVLTLIIIGAINWGLIAAFNFDLVASLFGTMTMFTRIIYGLIGLAGLWAITFFGRMSVDE